MGPLEGIRVIEIAGIGPGPFCGMMLSDMGAEVLRIDRADRVREPGVSGDLLARGRRSVGVDLKSPKGVEVVMKLIEKSDALFEGFRPGVMERLGLGPEPCLARNSGLVYGRMTGWGQDGPMAMAAGHDINYISLAGALEPLGRKGEKPMFPLNLIGDFGGGGLILAFGIACAIIERQRSGKGQVVDAAMVDGAAILMAMFHGMQGVGFWQEERGTNLLDSGAHFYDVYECKDGKFISIGSIEPQFYSELLRRTGLDGDALGGQMDRSKWEANKGTVEALFKTKTRDEWCTDLEGTDVCFAPVLSMKEAPDHPHNKARGTFVEREGLVQPSPAPRFSRTAPGIQGPPPNAGTHTNEALADWGFDSAEIESLRAEKAIA
ncbi:MAG: CaiB/BaiF CoA-transferase family protein [Candidatus Binatia bacterium]|nr:CaiB/BaiF CoA-transferase family protein [Candidatus Binatia bacterium]